MIALIGKQMLKWAIILGLCVFVWALFSQAQAAEVAVQPVTLQDSLVSIIQQVQSGVSAGVSFLSAEIPDVIKQLLIWKAVEAIFWASFEITLVILATILVIKTISMVKSLSSLEAVSDTAKDLLDNCSRHHDDYKRLEAEYKNSKVAANSPIPAAIMLFIGTGVMVIIGLIAFLNIWGNLLTALQIWIAPKVWLIEYAAHLVK